MLESTASFKDDYFKNPSNLKKMASSKVKTSAVAMEIKSPLEKKLPSKQSSEDKNTPEEEVSKRKWKESYAMNMKELIRKVGRSANTTAFNPPKEIVEHMRKSKKSVQQTRKATKYQVGNVVGSMDNNGKVTIEHISSDEGGSSYQDSEEEI